MNPSSDFERHLDRDEILDLVMGLGSADERTAWLQHVRTCPQCEDELQRSSEVLGRARLDVASVIESLDRGAAKSTNGRAAARSELARRRIDSRWILLGAGLAAAVAAVVLRPEPSPLLGQLRPLPRQVEFVQPRDSGDHGAAACLAPGLEAYARGDYASAARLLGGCEAEGGAETMRRLYLGSALALCGRFDRAAKTLEGLPSASIPEAWRGEADWTRCVASYGCGREREGDSLLAGLASAGGADAERAIGLREALAASGRRRAGRP